ncbi:NAD(P)H:quinone oxidoreductase [Glaciecola sp. MH2013]|uniref:NAD(P)H:quinone oxidoreductase n=1 Tax=Glaciecola sp. MH2013 TaxID=2785524 RepID=UPI00189EF2AC|nr:NAD(P)H:quinone oxidoreductase [Glaciecola sp. MH2013]MBF7072878.1 NAD(P)H:quinone oxidoreductase [Glaciecola sp. MH2013]
MSDKNSVKLLILYYSRHGITEELAKTIAMGAQSTGASVSIRTVPDISANNEAVEPSVPRSGVSYASLNDLVECDGLALGSPTHFGNMAAPMKYFIDSTSQQWLKGTLIDKPACVFSSTSSLHGGQESTLLSMMLPLFHQGMLVFGLPYSEPGLHKTEFGGTPYGATAVSRPDKNTLSAIEKELAYAQGKRLAKLALKYKETR